MREGLMALGYPVRDVEARRPSEPLTLSWYVENRLREQKDRFYANGQKRNEVPAARLRVAAFYRDSRCGPGRRWRELQCPGIRTLVRCDLYAWRNVGPVWTEGSTAIPSRHIWRDG